jgi:hypothetical protein
MLVLSNHKPDGSVHVRSRTAGAVYDILATNRKQGVSHHKLALVGALTT